MLIKQSMEPPRQTHTAEASNSGSEMEAVTNLNPLEEVWQCLLDTIQQTQSTAEWTVSLYVPSRGDKSPVLPPTLFVLISLLPD